MESSAFVRTNPVYNRPAFQQQFDLVWVRTFITSGSVCKRVKAVVRALVGGQAMVGKKSPQVFDQFDIRMNLDKLSIEPIAPSAVSRPSSFPSNTRRAKGFPLDQSESR